MANENREIFAKNLRYYMEQSGKTQADICRLFNISSATASNWCNGKIMPRSDKIYTLSEWLGVEPSQLITERSHYENLDKFLYSYSLLDNEGRELVVDLIDALESKEQHSDRIMAWMQKFLELTRPQK